ncbi:MAG: protease modulator HflC [Alphaproteobacteria bacterium]
MSRGAIVGIGVALVIVVVVGLSATFTVHQAAQALVLQFGKPQRVVTEPGLHFKLPFIQNVALFDRRVLDFDVPAEEVIASDQKRLVVDSFARYRIIDPLRFFQSAGSEAILRSRLAPIINGSVRRALGNVSLQHIVSGERASLMTQISDMVNVEAEGFGIKIVDVRIKRTDLPEENSQAIYRRMQTERQREAKELRAQGEQKSVEIRAEADRNRTVILANAQKTSQITRGEGDSKAIQIYADAFGQDVEFFTFYRSMEAYRESLGGEDTTMVMSPDSEFFRYFRSLSGKYKSQDDQ